MTDKELEEMSKGIKSNPEQKQIITDILTTTNEIRIDHRRAMKTIKESMLAMSSKISCHGFNDAFCCINQ